MKNQQRDEKLSALLDNGLDEAQLQSFMEDLKRDPIADAESAQRYRLIGDAMRDEIDQSSFMDISSAVHRAIDQEPAYNEAPVRQQKSAFSLSALLSGWVKPLTGMAVAASVAMVTLVTFNTVQNNDAGVSSNQFAQVEQARVAPVQIASAQLAPAQIASVQRAPIERVSSEIARNVQVASTLDISKTTPQQQQQLNHYLLQHSGYASQTTMQGMMPYVRAADVKSQEVAPKQ